MNTCDSFRLRTFQLRCISIDYLSLVIIKTDIEVSISHNLLLEDLMKAILFTFFYL